VTTTREILAMAEPWVQACGACDAGLTSNCTHPKGDYRNVILALMEELERLSVDLVTKPRPLRDDDIIRVAGYCTQCGKILAADACGPTHAARALYREHADFNVERLQEIDRALRSGSGDNAVLRMIKNTIARLPGD